MGLVVPCWVYWLATIILKAVLIERKAISASIESSEAFVFHY